MPITHLIFDLDDTLYPAGNGLWDEIGERINLFIIEKFGVSPLEVNDLRRHYYLAYGTTLRGLMTEHPQVNPDDYLQFVHAVQLERYVLPNPALETMLASLPHTKAIFTNSDTPHAQRVLNCLGIAHHFSTIVDIKAMAFANKPDPKSYEVLLNTLKVKPENCLYIEDSLRNLTPAKALGFSTLLVGNGHAPDPAVDYSVTTIMEIADVVRGITNVND